MGAYIYRDDKWDEMQYGVISRQDIMRLDREEDRYLIEWFVLHAREPINKIAMHKYGITEMPEETVNVDDPDDETFRTYYILREQAARENSYEVLRHHAFCSRRDDMSRFAFCRLTGFSWLPDECDAYSYRTYWCGLMSDVMREDIEDLCREMIEKNGPFAEEAREWLAKLPDISEEQLDEWASWKNERKEPTNPREKLKAVMRSADGSTELSDEELKEKIRGAADAWILINYEKTHGRPTRRRLREITDPFIRAARELIGKLDWEMIPDTAEAVTAVLIIGGAMPRDLTREEIIEIVHSESDGNPLHGYYLELAEKYDIK